MPDAQAVLRRPFVLRFAIARGLGQMATSSTAVAIGWQIYEVTNSKVALGLVGLAQVVPVVGLSLVVGVIVDRFPRRRVAIVSHLLLATCVAVMLLAAWSNAPPAVYYVALFVHGVGNAFRGPSVVSMLPQLVPPEDFANANAWISSMFELSGIVGPAVAGILIGIAASSWLSLSFSMGLHLSVIVILWTLPRFAAAARGTKVRVADLLAGVKFVFANKPLLAAATLDMFAVLLGGATALLPVFAKDILAVGPMGLGWLRSAPAVGAMSMALLTTHISPWKRPGRALLFTVAGFGIATIAFGLSANFVLSLAALFFVGVFDNVSVVIRNTLQQSLTPDSMRGRVSAISFVFIGISNELGGFESGITAEYFGAVPSVVCGGIGTLVVVLIVAWRFPELLPLPPLRFLKPIEMRTPSAEIAVGGH